MPLGLSASRVAWLRLRNNLVRAGQPHTGTLSISTYLLPWYLVPGTVVGLDYNLQVKAALFKRGDATKHTTR